jgi:formylglycine-generating enzyme required for sulfatase activity
LRNRFELVEPRRFNWAQSAALARVDAAASLEPAGDRRWFRNGFGDTLAVVKGPVEFQMGSAADAHPRRNDERQHMVRIGRSFAIGTTTVTVVQIHKFLRAHPEVHHLHPYEDSPDPDGPAMSLNWYDGAEYCRWLSECEGIPEDQMCYPPVAVIEASKDGNKPLTLPADALSRTGYRMPTEAEWEYACRAGAKTLRFYGNADELLGHYAWYAPNSGDRAWSVARKMPNDLGLFDIHGNIWQWCHGEYGPYADDAKGAVNDASGNPVVDGVGTRPLRGGTFFLRGTSLRSAYRLYDRPTYGFLTFGLRIAKTVK